MKNETKIWKELTKSFLYLLFLAAGVWLACFFGYEKLNLNKTVLAVNQINERMHEAFAEYEQYPSAEIVAQNDVAPQELAVLKAKEYFWRHYFGGNMLISGCEQCEEARYNVIFNNLSRRKCMLLAGHDWRDNENFEGITAQNYSVIAANAADFFAKTERILAPISVENFCSCEGKDSCSVILVYR